MNIDDDKEQKPEEVEKPDDQAQADPPAQPPEESPT